MIKNTKNTFIENKANKHNMDFKRSSKTNKMMQSNNNIDNDKIIYIMI